MKLQRVLLNSISVICALLALLPICKVYVPYLEEGSWENMYFRSGGDILILLSPFFLSWILFLFLNNAIILKILNVLLILISGFYLVWLVFMVTLPVPDIFPSIGGYLMALLFPLVIALTIVQSKIKKGKSIKFEDILDQQIH
ncbi:MAG: hypothetical protein DWQ02_11310 [Bacteroidetes bacterium]|nr:MAG: hypothetical protein DWQ02_11310 [Bacteroidota bacterium]